MTHTALSESDSLNWCETRDSNNNSSNSSEWHTIKVRTVQIMYYNFRKKSSAKLSRWKNCEKAELSRKRNSYLEKWRIHWKKLNYSDLISGEKVSFEELNLKILLLRISNMFLSLFTQEHPIRKRKSFFFSNLQMSFVVHCNNTWKTINLKLRFMIIDYYSNICWLYFNRGK